MIPATWMGTFNFRVQGPGLAQGELWGAAWVSPEVFPRKRLPLQFFLQLQGFPRPGPHLQHCFGPSLQDLPPLRRCFRDGAESPVRLGIPSSDHHVMTDTSCAAPSSSLKHTQHLLSRPALRREALQRLSAVLGDLGPPPLGKSLKI